MLKYMTPHRLPPLLPLDPFPPQTEVLSELIMGFHRHGTSAVALFPGRFFCWSFDPALRDAQAYPEDLYRGLIGAADKREMRLVPVLSFRQVLDFLAAHPEAARSVTTGSPEVGTALLRSIMESMFEDLRSIFGRDDSMAFLPDRRTHHPLQRRCEELFPEVGAAFGVEPLVLDGCGCRGGGEWDLPAPPEWLERLEGDQFAEAGFFLERYAAVERSLKLIWRFIRFRWEELPRNLQAEREALHAELLRLPGLMESCEESGRRLFIPPWFSSLFARRRRALCAALLHLEAGTGGPDPDLVGSIISLNSPIDDGEVL